MGLFDLKRDTYKSLLRELKNINKQIAELNKNVKAVKTKIVKKKDEAAADKIRKKIGIK